jgi:hypothetical protein
MSLAAKATLAVALAAFGTAPAFAAEALWTEFTVANVTEVLTGVGATDIKAGQDSEGNKTLDMTFADGPAQLTFVSCRDGSPCKGVQIAIGYSKLGDTFNAAFANRFNKSWLAATAIAEDDGSLTLADYVIAKGGISRDSLRENLLQFLTAPAMLAEEIAKLQVASAPPTAPTLTAVSAPNAAALLRRSVSGRMTARRTAPAKP